MALIPFVGDIIKIIKSNDSPGQVAAGFTLGMLMGITPFWSLLNLIMLLVLILINIQIAAAMLAYALATAFVYIFDPWLHQLGWWMLVKLPALEPLWTTLYNAPLFPYTRYNNTVYLGSLLVGLLLAVPVYFGMKVLIGTYVRRYKERVQQWKAVRWFKATKVYEIYDKAQFWRG